MFRVSIKNTFLTLEETDQYEATSSAFIAPSGVTRSRSMGHVSKHDRDSMLTSGALQHLNVLLQSPRYAHKRNTADVSAEVDHAAKLRHVPSNGSLVTMAPDSISGMLDSPRSSYTATSEVSDMYKCSCDAEFEMLVEDGDNHDSREVASSQCDLPMPQNHLHIGLHRLQRNYQHWGVPRTVDLAKEFEKQVSASPPTTLMLRNVPNRYSQSDLVSELAALGFAETYDFLYLPIDKGTLSNVGYAFINFTHHNHAGRFKTALCDHQFKQQGRSAKRAIVSVAHLQGLEANIRHYEKTAVSCGTHKQRRPVVFAKLALSV